MRLFSGAAVTGLGLLVGSITWAWAQAPDGSASPDGFHIQPLDPDFDASKMVPPGASKVRIHPVPKDSNKGSAVTPSPAQLAELFEKSGISSDTAAMDQVDRDLLYLRARKYPLAKLQETYPRIPKPGLKRFSELVK